MTTPVKPINKKVGVLKMGWLVVKDVLIELATVIVYYGTWRVLWALVGSHDFKPIAYCMWAVDCSQR